MHCLSRTPSTKKTQLGSNYSALSLKFGALESGRVTTLNRANFVMASSHNSSEISQIKDARHNDELGNFACRTDDMPPYLMCHPYQSIVTMNPSCEPVNYSSSQLTTSTILSRDNSAKGISLKKGRIVSTEPGNILQQPQQQLINAKNSTFTQKLKKCTRKVLTFKTEANSPALDGKPSIKKKISDESIKSGNTISNSSLKEIDEEEFTSSELAQMMFEVNNEIRHLSSSQTS